jgi:hypothetical protein
VQDSLALKNHDDVYVRDVKSRTDTSRESMMEAELEAFRACQFQSGFTSEGMLCDEPPIPLRVLDFLETQDLVRLSFVCKSTHQAAHLVFQREVRPLIKSLQYFRKVKDHMAKHSKRQHSSFVEPW